MNSVLFFKALADETRLRIVHLLRDHELNVNELTAILEMGQSRISRHLKILTDSEIISFRRDGLWSFYSITGNSRIQRFIEETSFLLAAMPQARLDLEKREQVLKQRRRETTVLFNSLAGHWEKIKQEIFGNTDVNREILDTVDPCLTLVDIGCGTGDLIRVISAKAQKVIGVDNSPRMLEQAAGFLEAEKAGIDLRLGNIEHLPLRDNETDAAVLNMVLHHCETPVLILKEANRVLHAAGTLVLADFLKHNREIMRARYGDRRLGFDPAELESAFTESGFTVKESRIIPLEGGLKIILYKAFKEEDINAGS